MSNVDGSLCQVYQNSEEETALGHPELGHPWNLLIGPISKLGGSSKNKTNKQNKQTNKNKTKQNKTKEQNKTKQNKTKQKNKTKQNKTQQQTNKQKTCLRNL